VVRYGTAGVNEFLLKFAGERQIERTEGMPAVGAAPDAPLEPDAEAAELDTEAAELGVEEAELDAETAAPEIEDAGGAPEAEAPDTVKQLIAALEGEIGPLELERVEFVGPKVGAELRSAGVKSLLIAAVLILAYIWFRFSVRFAPGAVVALVHDVLITAGFWVILGLEFDLRVLAALLAIVGYSLNDTIIVYDRIRENMEIRTTRNMEEVLNLSVNQTLSRTLLTSLTTLVAVLSLLLLGGEVIRPFALAMVIGIAVGTYSSVYVAAPMLLLLERRFGAAAS
jgi:preprotein translocase SecF subunit